MCGGELTSSTVGPTEHDRDIELTTGHVADLGRVVDDLVNRHEGEVERHEFNNRAKTTHCGPDGQAAEAVLGNRGVDDALGTELVQHAFTDFVGSIVLGDFFTQEEYTLVAHHFLGHSRSQGLTEL